MFAYPVTLMPEKKGTGFVVTFPDIPEAITQGNTVEEALKMAAEALESAMDFYFEDRREVPMPSAPKRRQHVVELPTSLVAKILLLNEMIRQNIRPAELARRLKTRPQDINRLIDLKHTTKIDAVAIAVKALGKTLELSVS